jgi:hypothetical protein
VPGPGRLTDDLVELAAQVRVIHIGIHVCIQIPEQVMGGLDLLFDRFVLRHLSFQKPEGQTAYASIPAGVR